MRKSSMVLGLIGGILAVLIGLLIIAGGAFFTEMFPTMMESEIYSAGSDFEDFSSADMDMMSSVFTVFFTAFGAAILIAGILGVIGAAVVNKNNVLAGVLMLLGAAFTFFTVYAFISFILLLLGGIFALTREKSPNDPTFSKDFE